MPVSGSGRRVASFLGTFEAAFRGLGFDWATFFEGVRNEESMSKAVVKYAFVSLLRFNLLNSKACS